MLIQKDKPMQDTNLAEVFDLRNIMENILSQIKSAEDLIRFMRINKFFYAAIKEYLSNHPEIWQKSLLSHFGHQGFQLHLWENYYAKELFILLYIAMKKNIVSDFYLKEIWQEFFSPLGLCSKQLPEFSSIAEIETIPTSHFRESFYHKWMTNKKNKIYNIEKIGAQKVPVISLVSNIPLDAFEKSEITVNNISVMQNIIAAFPLNIFMINFDPLQISIEEFATTITLVGKCQNLRAIYFDIGKMSGKSDKKLLQQIGSSLKNCKQLIIVNHAKNKRDSRINSKLLTMINKNLRDLENYFAFATSLLDEDSTNIKTFKEKHYFFGKIEQAIRMDYMDFGNQEVSNGEILTKQIFFTFFVHCKPANLPILNALIEKNLGVTPWDISLREVVMNLGMMHRKRLIQEVMQNTAIFVVCNDTPVTIQQITEFQVIKHEYLGASLMELQRRLCLTYINLDKKWHFDYDDGEKHIFLCLNETSGAWKMLKTACEELANSWRNILPGQGFCLDTKYIDEVKFSTFGIVEYEADFFNHVLQINITLAKILFFENIMRNHENYDMILKTLLPVCLYHYGVTTFEFTTPFEILKSCTDYDICWKNLIQLSLDTLIPSQLQDLPKICRRLAILFKADNKEIAVKLSELFEFTYLKSLDFKSISVDIREFLNLLLPYLLQMEEPFLINFAVHSKLLIEMIKTADVKDIATEGGKLAHLLSLIMKNNLLLETRSIQLNDALFDVCEKYDLRDTPGYKLVAMWHFYNIDLENAFVIKRNTPAAIIPDIVPVNLSLRTLLCQVKLAASNTASEPTQIIEICSQWLKQYTEWKVSIPTCAFFSNPDTFENSLLNEKLQIYELLANSHMRLGDEMSQTNKFALAVNHYEQARIFCCKILGRSVIPQGNSLEIQSPISAEKLFSEITEKKNELFMKIKDSGDDEIAKEPDTKRRRLTL